MLHPGEHTLSRAHWPQWAETLRRYQLDGMVSWLLEAGRPFALLSAQILYIGQPFLGANTEALARMLESDEEAQDFAVFLDTEKRRADGGTVL